MNPKELLVKTRKDYDLIAKDWNIYRPFLEPYKQRLAKHVKRGEKVLDIGCGNGILYEFLAPKSIDYIGLDLSRELLKIARKRAKKATSSASSRAKRSGAEGSRPSKYRFILGEATKLPFKDQTFDWVFAFAIYHHLPTVELRQKALNEARRALKPGGKLVLIVMNLLSEYTRKKYKIRIKARDGFIPWKATAGKIVARYFHIFRVQEMKDLLKKSGFKNIKLGYIERDHFKREAKEVKPGMAKGRNLVAIAKK